MRWRGCFWAPARSCPTEPLSLGLSVDTIESHVPTSLMYVGPLSAEYDRILGYDWVGLTVLVST